MTAAAPWSVKGIDPKAREVAKDLARRSGLTLGEWLNQLILEDEGPEDAVAEADFGRRREPAYFETPRPAAPGRMEAPGHPADEIGRVALALDRLTERLEASEARTGLAVASIERSVREAVGRIEIAEREHIAVAARFEGAVEEVAGEQRRMADRLRRVEQEAAGPRSAEALRALEGTLGKVAGRLYEAEGQTRETLQALEGRLAEVERRDPTAAPASELIEEVVARLGDRLGEAEGRTAEALDGLRRSFAELDERMGSVEGGFGADVDRRLEHIAANLSHRVEAARAEIAEKLRAASDGRFDRMELKLAEMSGHVQAAEQRSAEALERMGREVLTVAETLQRRVQSAEQRSADALEQVGGEVARIANAMEARLGRAEAAQAQVLEKLGGEIARITERLTERIGQAERRSAQAIDDVGEQVARVTERLNHRHDRISDELADRIRQSEERTARLLEEAREKIDQRIAEAQRRAADATPPPMSAALPPVLPERAAPPPALAKDDPFGDFDDEFVDEAPARSDPLARQAFAEPAFPAADLSPETTRPPLAAEDFEAADGFGPYTPADEPLAMDEAEPAPPADPDRPLSTREVIEQARAAARAAGQPGENGRGRKARKDKAAAEPDASASIFSTFGQRPKKRAGTTLQTALMVAGGAAFLGLGAGGLVLMSGQPSGEAPARVADALSIDATAPAGSEGGDPLAASALAPGPLGEGIPDEAPAEAAGEDLAGLYGEAVRKIESKEDGGVEELRRAANLGHAPAQFYLAKLYENGEGGLSKDLAEARRWTQRAAEGGDRKAMHNLALQYFEGSGGAKNSTTAAQWFRRAADLGLVDSQYNLGRLYEEGFGVSQNAAEAYKWYLIAARSGDAESASSADRVKSEISRDAQVVAERAAAAFRPAQGGGALAGAAAPAAQVQVAQQALSRLGYYQGPADGKASPALRLALAAYQRDQGLAATGSLDQTTIAKLSVFTR